ncbi:hypothetical protein K0M31_017624 [Melipona bicolor]|uniref:Uncharacterized protein n=1 Tax=Melipona bicolor TaxID=60889 RepID=A0AA40KSQ2_9HYME|nr:hypothetical protein K0M31_017624 [Melipona bicolor]
MRCHAIGRGAEVTTGKEPHLGDRVTSFGNLVPGELKRRLSYLAMLGLAIRRGPSTKTTKPGDRALSQNTENRACTVVVHHRQQLSGLPQHLAAWIPLWCLRANGQVLTKANHF